MPRSSPRRRRCFLLLLLPLLIAACVLGWRGARRANVVAPLQLAAASVSSPRDRGTSGSDDRVGAGESMFDARLGGTDKSAVDERLFEFVSPPDAAALTRALPAPSQDLHYVRVNRALVTGKRSPFWQPKGRGELEVPLPDGSIARVRIDESEMLGADRFTSSGQIVGHPQSRALFAWHAGYLHASIEDAQLGTFALRTVTSELAQFYRIDPALVLPCGGERPASIARAALAAAPTPLASDAGPGERSVLPPVAAAENSAHAEVHVLMLYTDAVLATMSGPEREAALQSAFDLAIAKVNATFAASAITARVKLVRIAETHYNEDGGPSNAVQDSALTALYKTDDGQMDEIHALRDQCGADIVCLALERRDSISSGLSFLLDVQGDPTNPRFAFSVVQYSNVTGTNVVPHEFGHVFGCAHDRENALSGHGAFSFSYGYRFRGADGRQYHDIMSYPPGIELSYFSNPALTAPEPANAALGIPAGLPGESNSALTIERTAFATAGYRLQTQAAPGAGQLINVAMRAYVGVGEQVVIAGFVVEGARGKRLLLRGAGPALRTFGVNNALADPVLRVFSKGQLVAENDNWNTPAGANASTGPQLSAAAEQVRAFPFATGSTDAALLATFPPGAYSAVLEGVGGANGTGLVQAYDLSSGDGRVVNLAARGYAARDGREMIGGFVIEGAAGTTKRVLIRVLGPTLGRAPFGISSTLEDPEMELHNGAGELLLKADDWSGGAVGGASVENDFHPVVEQYDEQQIAATGLAPSNRREPCVLVDLPPGDYTVVVRPYELRSSNVLRDQPAVPGVGIVEVFEITR